LGGGFVYIDNQDFRALIGEGLSGGDSDARHVLRTGAGSGYDCNFIGESGYFAPQFLLVFLLAIFRRR
jgi:hypothetical protein